ncbi:MAG TPA: nuclear transport factor 2 family protein [Candidatus Polarisedimenticolaceae bacterium]|nr:nuclear transport factor 2 family protein [Candidatus Polarisedimenticolaceae bacterium]
MRRLVVLLAVALLGAAPSDETALRRLLDAFLAGASVNDPAVHARFWAEDLVYTSSAGKRMGKADILRDVNHPSNTDASPVTYTAQDVQVRLYGKTAVVAFRLVTASQQYFNTGTFVKRNGAWQAVAWQATKIPP